jgi:hypothetical protein
MTPRRDGIRFLRTCCLVCSIATVSIHQCQEWLATSTWRICPGVSSLHELQLNDQNVACERNGFWAPRPFGPKMPPTSPKREKFATLDHYVNSSTSCIRFDPVFAAFRPFFSTSRSRPLHHLPQHSAFGLSPLASWSLSRGRPTGR